MDDFTLSINLIFLPLALKVIRHMAADFPLSLAQTPFLILLTLHPNIYLQHSSPVQLYAAMEIKEDCQM